MTIKPIQTRYRGYKFRSRLEARYAVLFDSLGIPWEYEKEGFGLRSGAYLPDFWIPLREVTWPNAGYLVEIKPGEPEESEINCLMELTLLSGHHGYLLCGNIHDESNLQVLKTVCVRDEKSLEYWMGRSLGSPTVTTEYGDVVTLPKPLQIMQLNENPHACVLLGRDAGECLTCSLYSLLCASGAMGDLRRGFDAARSARFEHGESGAT